MRPEKPKVPLIYRGKKPMTYETRRLVAGDAFEAGKRASEIFRATGLAELDKGRRKPGRVSAPPPALQRRARAAAAAASPPADADPNESIGKEAPLITTVGSPTVPSAEERIDALEDARQAYKAKYGRLPHHTWDADRIHEKMED